MGFSFEEISHRKVYGAFDFSDSPNVDVITQKKGVESISSSKRKFSEEQSDSQVKTLCEIYVDIILISTIDARAFVNS